MSTVCNDPFATEPPPMESAASLDAVTAPGASWPAPTDPSPRSGASTEPSAIWAERTDEGGVAVNERTAVLLRSAFDDRAVLDLLARDRALANGAAVDDALGLGGPAERDEEGDEGDDHRWGGATACEAHEKRLWQVRRLTLRARRMLDRP